MSRFAPALLLLFLAAMSSLSAQERKGAFPTAADAPPEENAASSIAVKLGTVLMVLGFAGYLLKRMQERNKKEFLPDIDRAIPQAGKPRPSGLDVLVPKGLQRKPRPLDSEPAPIWREDGAAPQEQASIWRDGANPFKSASSSKPAPAAESQKAKFKPLKIEPKAARINQDGVKPERQS